MSDPDRRGWHVQKGVDAIHVLTTFVFIIGGFWFLAGQDKRISNLELSAQYAQENSVSQQQRTEKKLTELKSNLRDINSKLDRLIESQIGPPWMKNEKNLGND
jgi:uncharacterized protein HemX